MEHIFFSFWWLLFPLSAFVIGGFSMWLNYRRHRDHMDLLRSYADKGQEPPPEVLKAAQASLETPPDDYYGGRYARRAWRRGPLWAWNRVVWFGALAAGFGYAAFIDHGFNDGATHGFKIAAVVLAIMFFGSLMSAIVTMTWRDK